MLTRKILVSSVILNTEESKIAEGKLQIITG